MSTRVDELPWPPATAARSAARTRPAARGRARAPARRAAPASATSSASGFSHSTCSPASSAASTTSGWVGVGRGDEARLDARVGERGGHVARTAPPPVASSRPRPSSASAARFGQRDDVDLGDAGERGEVEAAHPAEADDGGAHRRGHGGASVPRESVRPWATQHSQFVSVCSASDASAGCTPTCSPTRCRARRSGWSTTPTRPPPSRSRAALDVPAAGSAEELLGSDDLDAVAICTSTDTHVELLVAAAASGKAIFCEKPISLDLAEVDRALALDRRRRRPAADRLQPPLRPGPPLRPRRRGRRFRSAPLHLVRISSRDPAPPPIAYIEVSGGIFLDMTCHDIDMARYVTGSEVVEVYANGAVRVDPAIGEAGDLDTAVLTLRHADGCLTVIDNSRRAAYGYDQRVEAFGDAGMASSQNPPAHTGTLLTADGTHGAGAPVLLHRALHRQLPPPVGGVLQLRARPAARRPCPAPTGGRRSPSGWPPGARCAKARPVEV